MCEYAPEQPGTLFLDVNVAVALNTIPKCDFFFIKISSSFKVMSVVKKIGDDFSSHTVRTQF